MPSLLCRFFNRSQNEIVIPANNSPELSLEQILEKVEEQFLYKGEISLSFPSERNDYYSIRKKYANSWSTVISNSLAISKQGDVIDKVIFTDKPLNVQIASLIKPLHTGEIFGGISKLIYFLACLIGSSLLVTSTIIWINKLKKKRAKKRSKEIKKVVQLYN